MEREIGAITFGTFNLTGIDPVAALRAE